MVILSKVIVNWFDLIQSLGIIATLLFTAYSFQEGKKAQQIANLIAVTGQYNDIWIEIYRRPGLARITKIKINLIKRPITDEEAFFTKRLIFHLDLVYQANDDGLMVKLDGLKKDVKVFFSAPIPKIVWEKIKSFQNDDFVEFVERCLNGKSTKGHHSEETSDEIQ